MKSTGQNQESSKKKQAGEHLKSADKYLKQLEFDLALVEVERCLELDPGNFYAHAYKERIISLRSKHQQQAPSLASPPAQKLVSAQQPPAPAAIPKVEKPTERHAAEKKPDAPVPLTQEEARKKFLEEKRRSEEDLRKQSEEARRRAEEELRRRAQELEAMHNSETIERRKSQEEEKRRSDDARKNKPAEDERARIESENRHKAEDAARKKLEEEVQIRSTGQQKSKDEAELLRNAESDARARAKEQKLHDYLLESKDQLSEKKFAEAVIPLLKILTLEPGHSEAQQMLTGLRDFQEQSWAPKIREAESAPRDLILSVYRKAQVLAWKEGTPDAPVSTLLQQLRGKLGITDAEHTSLDSTSKLDAYASVLQESSAADDDPFIVRLRNELKITDDQHRTIRQKVQPGVSPRA